MTIYGEHLEAGIGHVPSFQVSGHPFLTGSALADGEQSWIKFPMVTKAVAIVNAGSGSLRLHYANKDNVKVYDNRHYITIPSCTSLTYNVKCKELFISNASGQDGDFELMAELTRIDQNRMYRLSGSGIDE